MKKGFVSLTFLALLLFSSISSVIAQANLPISLKPRPGNPYVAWKPYPGTNVQYQLTIREYGFSGGPLSSRTIQLGSQNYAALPKSISPNALRYEFRIAAKTGSQIIAVSDALGYELDGPAIVHCSYECPTGGFKLEVVSPADGTPQYRIISRPTDEPYYQYMSAAEYNASGINWPLDGYWVDYLGIVTGTDYCNSLGINLQGQDVYAVYIPFPEAFSQGQTSIMTTNPCNMASNFDGMLTLFNLYVETTNGGPLSCPPLPCVGGGSSSVSGNSGNGNQYIQDWIDQALSGLSLCDLGILPDEWCDEEADGGIDYNVTNDILTGLSSVDWSGQELGNIVHEIAIQRIDDFSSSPRTRYNISTLDAQFSGSPKFNISLAAKVKGLYTVTVIFKGGRRISRYVMHNPGVAAKQATLESGAPTVQVYPSPANDVAQVALEMPEAAKVNIQLLDLRGVVLQASELDLDAGTHECRLDVRNLPAGIYLVKISSEKFSLDRRVQILH